MEIRTEKFIYMKASRCYDCLEKCLEVFERLLGGEGEFKASDYYYARNILRDGKDFFQETLKEAKKLLGPMPEYVTKEFEQWRAELLEKDNILAKSQEIKELHAELVNDELLSKWATPEEIEHYLEKHFQAQQQGKRKLSNIKVRVILHHLENLISKAEELQKEALKRQQESF